MRSVSFCGALCAVLAIGCGEETGPNVSGVPGVNISRVEISPKLDTLFVADTVRATDRLQMTAQVFNWTGRPMTGVTVAWSSSDVTVATVSSTGLVIPTGFGTTEITASATKVAKATIVVLPATRSIQITPSSDSIFVEDPIVSARDTVRLRAMAFDETGTFVSGIRFSWTSSSPAVATVDGSGVVSGRALGVTTITAQSGAITRSATVRVASAVKTIQLTAAATTVLARDTVQLTAVALGYDDRPMPGRTIQWTSSNPTVASVDANGRVIFLRSGSATFTAKSAHATNASTVTALDRQLQVISSGNDFTCGYANLGRGYCWGRGDLGQLASAADSLCFDGSTSGVLCAVSPKRFSGPPLELIAIDAGGRSACGIAKDRLVYCWGSDEVGQLGNGALGGGAQPTLASVAQERFDSITVGAAHACALNTARFAYCWGSDALGQLGDNGLINSTTPIPVIGGLAFSTISAGGQHTCAISNGQAYCWGANESGQLGDGSAGGYSATPVAVAGGHTFVAIGAGQSHTCALTSAGQAMCWGSDSRGQIGSGTLVSVPTSVGGPTFTRLSVGSDHTCALAAGGTVSCWGWNSQGQAGSALVPGIAPLGSVAGGVAFRSVAAGADHTCGVGTDGETYCWGSNVFGALGNELQAAYRVTPQKVAVPR